MGASTNPLCDEKNRLSVCISGQVALSILMNELRKVPTLKLVSLNTDSIQFEIDEDKVSLAEEVLNHWQKQYRLELERDDVIKLVMRDINNYATILETPKGKEVKFKGSCFAACPKIIIDENNKIITKYEPKFKSNNLVIVSEALAKYLLFDIPIEKTITNCDDIRKYMMISHLGSTYEKCVQESPNGDILLQNNNRVYAGLKPSGKIVKVKPDGRRDSLSNQPPNPIVDNGNKCTIDQINKQWYIKLATQWANDFLGVKRLTEYKKEELLTMASNLGIVVDKKIKKDDLIKLIEERNEVKNMATKKVETNEEVKGMNIYEKLNRMKAEISTIDFIMDRVLPSNMGGGEYASIGQLYGALHKECIKYNVYFQWDVVEVGEPKDLFKPTGKLPQYVWDGTWRASFINIDNPNESVVITTKASGSDICDKGISSSSTMAFRNFFDKNFTPKYLNQGGEEVVPSDEEKTEAPKVPVYIAPERKEEIKKEVVETKQHEESDDEDIKEVISKIMKVRELSGNAEWGKETLKALYSGEVTSADILAISLKVDAKLESLEVNE